MKTNLINLITCIDSILISTKIEDETYFKIYDIILLSDLNYSNNLIKQIKLYYKTEYEKQYESNNLIKLFAELDFINDLCQIDKIDKIDKIDNKQLLFDHITRAVQYGNINLIKYCYEEYGTLDSDVLNNALLCGQLDILIFCYSNDCYLNKELACRKAVIGKNIKCLRYVHNIGGQIDLETLLYAIKYNLTDCFDYIMENINLVTILGLDNLTKSTNNLDLTDLTELIDTIITQPKNNFNTIITQQKNNFNQYYFDKVVKCLQLPDQQLPDQQLSDQQLPIQFILYNLLINLSLFYSNSEFLVYGLKQFDNAIQYLKINPANIVKNIDTNDLTCFFIIHDFIILNNEKYSELFDSFNDSTISEALIKKNDLTLFNFLIKHKYKLNSKCALQASLNALKTKDIRMLQLLVEDNNCPLSSDIISAIIESNSIESDSIESDTVIYLLEQNISLNDENYFLAFLYNRLDIVDLFIQYNKLNHIKTNIFVPNSDVIIGAIMSKDINCVKYCNELLKSLYLNKQALIDNLLQSDAIAHAVKFNLVEIINYLLYESYQITSYAITYGAIFNSIESFEVILPLVGLNIVGLNIVGLNNTDKITANNFITSDTLNSAITYDNVECLQLLITYGNIQLTKSNIICCFENDSFKCIKYICSLDNEQIIEAYNEIDQKILKNEIKDYLIKNNLIKLN